MERPINESTRLLNLQQIIERARAEKSDEAFNMLTAEIDFLIESNSCLKEYVIKNADKINNEYFSYPVLVRKVLDIEHFTMVRYQDGEWTCMLKVEPHFSNKILKYGKELDEIGDQLLEIVKSNPDYYISTVAGTFYERASIAWPFLKKLKNLYVGEVFRRKSVEEGLDDFVKALNTRTVILVGPGWLSPLEKMFANTHVICSGENAVKEKEMKDLDERLHKAILNNIDKDPVILYSCFIPAKIIAHKYWELYKDKITQIDTGAIWDPYCGKKTRPYHESVIKRLGTNFKI
jgi:hypothetical protein